MAVGQGHQEKIRFRPGTGSDYLANPMQPHVAGTENLPVYPEDMYSYNAKSLTWNWDTIITYDTVGLYQRFIQTFDLNGNVINQCTQQWQTNAWVNSYKYTYILKYKDHLDKTANDGNA